MRKEGYGAASSSDVPNMNGVVEPLSAKSVVNNDNESTPLTQAVAVGAQELQSAPSFVTSVKVNDDKFVDVLETPLASSNIPAYIRSRGVVEAPAVWYYSMHRQDDRTTIQIRWLGKTQFFVKFYLVAGLIYTTPCAIACIQEGKGRLVFLSPVFWFTYFTIYQTARYFFNSTYITITHDGVEVDEKPLKKRGLPQMLGFVDKEGLPVEFVVKRNIKTVGRATKLSYSVNQLDGNQQPMAVLRWPQFLGGKHETLHIVQEIGRYAPPRTVEARLVAEEDIVEPEAGQN